MRESQKEIHHEAQSSQENLLIPRNKQHKTHKHAIEKRKDEITLENYEKTYVLALERIDPKGIAASSLIINFAGCI